MVRNMFTYHSTIVSSFGAEAPHATIESLCPARKVKNQLLLPGSKHRFAYIFAHSIISVPELCSLPVSSRQWFLFHTRHDIPHVQCYTMIYFELEKSCSLMTKKCALYNNLTTTASTTKHSIRYKHIGQNLSLLSESKIQSSAQSSCSHLPHSHSIQSFLVPSSEYRTL